MRFTFLLLLLFTASLSLSQNKKYTFIFLNHKPDADKISKEESDNLMKGHMANMNRLAKEGKLIAAGPFEGGGGIFVLNTASIEEAQAWLSTDPGVQAKRWDVEVLPFTVRHGGICHVNEPYEMVTYNFVRFKATVTKITAQDFPDILARHDDFLKQLENTGNVLIEGTFGDQDGGIIVMKGDLQREVVEQDPGVQETLITIDMKKLWIAKGAFCEK